MSDSQPSEEEAPKKGGKKGLLFGAVGALVLGGGAFYATYSGLLALPGEPVKDVAMSLEDTKPASFVPIDPIVISLGKPVRHQLRFNAQLEVEPSKKDAVANLMPRILDVLNGYLRAVDLNDLQEPTALIKLRVQMLRRVQLITGDGHVKDLLITEFVFT